MKTIISPNPVSSVQEQIDKMPSDALIAFAYNEDTKSLHFGGRRIIEVCDAGGIISSNFRFDVQIENYNEEKPDLCILGLGYKGQIGFNEVATPYDSLTHVQKLTESTKQQFSFLGEVPDFGMTMGVKSICESKRIIVLALGENKADAVFGMLYGRNDSTIPAAFLQIPVNVEVYLDEKAACRL